MLENIARGHASNFEGFLRDPSKKFQIFGYPQHRMDLVNFEILDSELRKLLKFETEVEGSRGLWPQASIDHPSVES